MQSMHVTLDHVVSGTRTAVKVYKWWKQRRDRAARIERRRRLVRSAALTGAAISIAAALLIFLAHQPQL